MGMLKKVGNTAMDVARKTGRAIESGADAAIGLGMKLLPEETGNTPAPPKLGIGDETKRKMGAVKKRNRNLAEAADYPPMSQGQQLATLDEPKRKK